MPTPEEPKDPFWSGLDPSLPYLDKETLIHLIESRVQDLLAHQPDLLWSFLYRLDVDETKIQTVLATSGKVAEDLARLILHRHEERLASQKKYKGDSSGKRYDWEDL